MTFVIYKATNILNSKSYIGFDSKWPRRQQNHILNSFNPKSPGYNTHFHRAIRKYGPENFTWEVIYKHWDLNYCLNVMEPLFINGLDKKYNEAPGGGGYVPKATTSLKGTKQSIEHKSKRSLALKARYHNLPPEEKQRIQERIRCREGMSWSTWIVTNPDGETYVGREPRQFCESRGVLWRYVRRDRSWNGWTASEVPKS